ncbi:MAG: lytic transglycosylase domain-containing protein [Acidobacteria bacterium]|nr:lytic transglycosylase domain-containing protein [Acidobacteriota bacterium]
MRFASRVATAATILLVAASSAGAELAVLTNGYRYKITAWELLAERGSVEAERIRLTLENGSSVTLPLLRIERIVDDEITDEPTPEPPPEAGFSLDYRPGQTAPAVPYGELFLRIGREHQLNPDLLAALARAESAYDPGAVSSKGARGLLQLMPATAERFGVPARELYDPARNVLAAARYLTWLRRRFEDDLPRVLAGYNAGEGAVDAHDGVPPYRETVTFIGRVYGYLGL